MTKLDKKAFNMKRLFNVPVIFILILFFLLGVECDFNLNPLPDFLQETQFENTDNNNNKNIDDNNENNNIFNFNIDNDNNVNFNNKVNNNVGYKQSFYKADGEGRWEMFVQDAGVSAMHLVINHANKAVFFDSPIYNPSKLMLPNGDPCRPIPGAQHGEVDCWAHAAEMDVFTGQIRPLKVTTDTWCSSGGFGPDGSLVQTGGWKDGGRAVRYLRTCDNCDWEEFPVALSGER
ncbi:uncharacterized protein A4U43_C05F19320, partial [Asparagus officinalis]